jgi:hypothetical protein
MNGPVGWGMRAASMVPGPVGLLGTLGGAGLRVGNAAYADSARPTWGQQGLNFGQYLGSALGLNSYGQGGRTDSLGQYNGSDVAPGGMASSGGFLGIGSSQHLAYTPAEAQSRYASTQAYGPNFQGPWSGPGNVPATSAPTTAVAAPRAPLATQPVAQQPINAFGVAAPQQPTIASAINDSGTDDPIGALIRGLGLTGGTSWSGGGHSTAGFGGGGGGGFGGDTGHSSSDGGGNRG